MASKRGRARAVKRLAMNEADVEELADKLFTAKRRVYRRTLLELATSLGYSISRPQLSPDVEAELRKEADRNARRIAATYNRDLAEAGSRYEGPDSGLDDELHRWARARQRARAQTVAVTESYSAHADAILSAVRDLGIEPWFDFGGGLNDDAPECDICVALMAHNPHPLEEVLSIGTPHVNCRQDWHPTRFDTAELPPDPVLGQTVGGLLGGENFLHRHGNDRAKAVAAVQTLARERE